MVAGAQHFALHSSATAVRQDVFFVLVRYVHRYDVCSNLVCSRWP